MMCRKSYSKYMKVRRIRKQSAAKRLPRLSRLKCTSRRAAATVYCAGVQPSLLYDSPIHGLFGRDLVALRRQAGSMLGIAKPRRNLDLGFGFYPHADPEIISASNLLKQYVGEIWDAAQPKRKNRKNRAEVRCTLASPSDSISRVWRASRAKSPSPKPKVSSDIWYDEFWQADFLDDSTLDVDNIAAASKKEACEG